MRTIALLGALLVAVLAAALVRGSGWFDNEVVVPPREAFLGEAEGWHW